MNISTPFLLIKIWLHVVCTDADVDVVLADADVVTEPNADTFNKLAVTLTMTR